jgi:hypothetical protein
VVHSDLWGSSPIVSKNDFRYYVHFVDEFSKFSWIYFLRTKDELVDVFMKFKCQVENLFSSSIKILQTDGGTEFKPLTRLFPQILHQVSCPYTPQQNGIVERKHRHIVELYLATMSHSSIPLNYWDHIFQSVVFIINRLPPTAPPHTSPFTILFNKNPDYTFFRLLGCLCCPWIRPYNSHKLQFCVLPCVFLGYCQHQKGYKCLHIPSNKIYISRNIRFDEHSFPFASLPSPDSPTSTTDFPISISLPLLQVSGSASSHLSLPQPTSLEPIPSVAPPLVQPKSQLQVYQRRSKPMHHSVNTPAHAPSASLPCLSPAHAPSASTHPMITRSRVANPNQALVTNLTTKYCLPLLNLAEPISFTEANKHPQWREAMSQELNALAKNETWILVPSTQINMSLVANRCSNLNDMSMGLLSVTKRVLLLRVIIKKPVLTIMRRLVPLSNLPLFV